MPADAPPLSLRALNRATLARQFLLERTDASALAVTEHLLGLQSQQPAPPYVGLWARIGGSAFSDLASLIATQAVVRIGLMRGTIHAVSAADAAGLWPLVAPIHRRSFDATRRPALEAAGVNVDEAIAATTALLQQSPHTPAALGAALMERWPQAPPAFLGSIARHLLPVVQVPPRGLWGETAPATYALLDHQPGVDEAGFAAPDVVRRYLAAFGPASVADFQQWCGLKGQKPGFHALDHELISFTGPGGKLLYDLANAPRPADDAPAPVRLLPEWDNLLLSHADRTRVIDEDRRKAIMSVNGINDAVVLVDGRVEATWKATRQRGVGRVSVAPFGTLSARVSQEIQQEARALLGAMGEGFATGEVVVEPPGSAWAPSWKSSHRRSPAGGR